MKCSLCDSPNVNKNKCPLNQMSNNKDPKSHPYSCDTIECIDKRVEILGTGSFSEVFGYICRKKIKSRKRSRKRSKNKKKSKNKKRCKSRKRNS